MATRALVDDQAPQPGRRHIRVVVADDDPFALSLVADGLKLQGFEVATALTVAAAWALVESTEPHALITDLNFGFGESGAALLSRVHSEYPWIGLVVLTSHLSPVLAVDDATRIPDSVVYLVKSRLRDINDLAEAVREAIGGNTEQRPQDDLEADTVFVTPAQAEVLRMLAEGVSTRALAAYRGTTVRAAETMLARLYGSLGLLENDAANPRVGAVLLWQQGKVRLR
jgi:DNA-binding NarL/FixJ family response regulator